MEMWFSDQHTENVKLFIRNDELFSAESELQRIDVLESKGIRQDPGGGRGSMLTEKDEFIYHEMIHPRAHGRASNVKNVLVIGGATAAWSGN